jgi:hypothetical protein
MCEIRTALNDLGKAEDPFERSGALEALAALLRREAPASVVMGAGTAELVATGGARAQAKQIADLPEDAAEARLRRLESIARPHRRKEPLSPRRRHLLERNNLPIRGTLRAPPSVATQDFLEDLGLKADTIRTVADPADVGGGGVVLIDIGIYIYLWLHAPAEDESMETRTNYSAPEKECHAHLPWAPPPAD